MMRRMNERRQHTQLMRNGFIPRGQR
jgi:hypothetical protein